MMNKVLIAVTAGVWQLKTIKKAKEMGAFIIAIDSSASAEGLLLADIAIVANLDDFSYVVDEINKQLLNSSVFGVLSICSDAGMLLAGKLRDYYQVKTGPGFAVSQRLINKALQRECWQRANVNGPKWYSSNNIDELFTLAQKMPIPFMIKPVDSAGSRGVIKITTIDENTVHHLIQAMSFSASKQVIIESFMLGTEYTVEAFVHNGETQVLAITEKDKINATQGLVAYRLSTTLLDKKNQNKIRKLVVKAVSALGYRNGPCHAEVILMPDKSVGMVELAGRGGGFLVFERFVLLASGVDIIHNTIKQALALPFTQIKITPSHCILHFFPNKLGMVTAISGFEQANAIENIDANTFVKLGDKLNEASCDGDRMGFVISNHKNSNQASKQLSKAIDLINFEVKA